MSTAVSAAGPQGDTVAARGATGERPAPGVCRAVSVSDASSGASHHRQHCSSFCNKIMTIVRSGWGLPEIQSLKILSILKVFVHS